MLDLALPLADLLPRSAGPYIALILIGFSIGILGHLSTARWLVTAGIILIFLGALLFPIAVNFTQESPPRIEAPEEGSHALEAIP
jgi:hypothetical protein